MSAARALLAGALLLSAPAGAAAQFLDAALPHRGELRTGFVLSQSIYDRVFREDGGREPLDEPFARPLDARFFPQLADVDTAVANLLAAVGGSPPSSALALGRARLDLQAEVSELRLELLFGVTSWLAVGGELPIVRARVLARGRFEAGSRAAGPASTAFGGTFFDDLDAALAELDALIASGTLDPSEQAQAEALRARTGTYADGLDSLSARYLFLPTDSGAAGAALGTVHDEIASGFDAFGIAFPALDLADPLAADAALALLSDSLAMPAFTGVGDSYRFGDAGLQVFVQPWNSFRRAAPADGGAALRGRLVLGAVYRFDTGWHDGPDRPYDLSTGRGSPSTEARAALDLAWGRKLWLTLGAEAVFQEAYTLDRRVAPPDTPLVDPSRAAAVERTPGDLWRWTVLPRYNLNEALSVGLIVQGESRKRDAYAYVGTPISGVSADVLGIGSDVSLTRWGLELRYRATGVFGEARARRSVEGVFSYRRTTSAGGRAPVSSLWHVGARWYP